MQFMVIEHFRNRDPRPIYRRVREGGRLMPEGLKYVASWIEPNFDRCFQVMECDDLRPLQQWVLQWSDLQDCEIVPVLASAETRANVEAFLQGNARP